MLSFRKGFALVLAASMFVAVGCGGTKAEPKTTDTKGAETAAAPKDPVKIDFWNGMADDSAHGKVTKQLVDEFNATHKDIIVTSTYQGSYTDVQKKYTAALNANTPPAVVQNTDSMLTTLVQQKAIVPLEGLIPANELSDFPDSLLAAQKVDGKLYALPFNKSAIVVFYNKNIVKTPPKNWDEFKQIAQQVTVKDKVYGTAFTADVYYFGTHFGQTGGQWLKDGKATFNGPEGQQALQLIVDMAKNGSAIQLKPNEYQSDYFNQGRAAMIAATTASFAYIKPVDGAPWGVAPLYAGPKDATTPLSGANLSITAGLPKAQQDAAVTFIRWMTSKETTLKWAMGKTGYGPVRKSALDSQEWKDFVAKNPEYGVLGDALVHGGVQPSIPQWGDIQKEITTAVQKALLGQASVKDALDAAAAKANELLAKK